MAAAVRSDLLEREAELAALEASLSEVRAGSGRLVLVAGEAGVGKSALVRSFCADAAESTRVLTGACDPLFTPRPLGPFVDVARTMGGTVADLVRGGSNPYSFAEELVEELTRVPPTIVLLEDLHWADEATLDVIRFIAGRIERLAALLIVTYRDDELGRDHPLRVVLGSLATVPGIRRVRVRPLSRGAVGVLADPCSANADELYRLTSGNPFFVTEVLATLPDQVPETVRDAVLARAARLSADARPLLDALSVLPSGADAGLLEALAHPSADLLTDTLASGMLTTQNGVLSFRHELARLTVEDAVPLAPRVELHRAALAELEARPADEHDLARLAHHADGAGDAPAVLRFAPRAAEHASALGAHREAAGQYRRALRYADGLAPAQRASLLQGYSGECYLTDQADEAIAALRSAADVYRALGDRLKEGETIGQLAGLLWCPGRGVEGRRVGVESVTLLEQLQPTPELAYAYDRMVFLTRVNGDLESAEAWSRKATSMAEQVGDANAVEWTSGGRELLEIMSGSSAAIAAYRRRADHARRQGEAEKVVDILDALVFALVPHHGYTLSRGYIDEGVTLSRECGNELAHVYLLSHRARLELNQGRWEDAAGFAEIVLGERLVSTFPRSLALVTLALVRARRGDPNVWALLDEARDLSEPTGELARIAPVAAARGEAAWLSGRSDGVALETDTACELALSRSAPWALGELAVVRRRAGIEDDPPERLPEPHAHQIAGRWREAATAWSELSHPYESALALAEGDEAAQRRALEELRALGARPAAQIVARRLRESGLRGIPVGPRTSTRTNPAGLTARELEVLSLMALGLRNAEIAARLFLSRRTVDHHVSGVLRKLDAKTRGEAVARARRESLLESR
jgi:DNA-binding CsgD family transcriptional regulator/tetratricopeptide (TPR) repeat protein